MSRLQWSTADAVFVTEIDDEHREIFEALAELNGTATDGTDRLAVRRAMERLRERLDEHFAHEERLMRAARYDMLKWHKSLHAGARRRIDELAPAVEQSDEGALSELVEFLSTWLHNHTRVADRMMGAALRNHGRAVWKVTFHAGTKPLEGRKWVTADGEPFEPPAVENKL